MNELDLKENVVATEPAKTATPKKERTEKADRIESYGEILTDGTIIDCIYDGAKKPSCSFVVNRPNGKYCIEGSFSRDGITVFPPERHANRLRKRSVILATEPQDYGPSLELLNRIKAFLHKYLDLERFDISLIAAYVMMTWVYDAWNAFPYLRFQGQPATGKTRCIEVLKEICYRSVDLGVSPTRSALFRGIDNVRGTFFIDEADYEGDFRSDLIKLLNAGYKKEGLVSLSVANGDDWEPETFQVGCPKIIANRHSFNDSALETRCLTIATVFKKLDPRIPTEYPYEFKAEGEALRNQLLKWRIDHVRMLDHSDADLLDLDGRARQMCLPIYSAPPDWDFRKQLLQYMKNRSSLLSEADPVRIVLAAILSFPNLHTRQNLHLKDVCQVALEIGKNQDLPEYVFTPKKVAELVRSLDFKTSKWGMGTVVLLDSTILNRQRRRFDFGDDRSDASDPS